MKRIFIGIRVLPGPGLSGMLEDFKEALQQDPVRWTEPGNIHITLAFPGNTEDNTVRALGGALEEKVAGFGSFSIVLRGAGIFRSLREPKVIWTGLEHSDELLRLNVLVKDILTTLAIKIEDKPFSPHLTLGRIKKLSSKSSLEKLIAKYKEVEIQQVKVGEIILFESILKPSGPVYKPLGIYNL